MHALRLQLVGGGLAERAHAGGAGAHGALPGNARRAEPPVTWTMVPAPRAASFPPHVR